MKFTTVIHTCDAYEKFWEGFIHYFHENWQEWKYDIKFCTEEKIPLGISKVKGELIKAFLTGRGEWSDRLIHILRNAKDKYVFYIQEDYWLNRKLPSSNFIEGCVDLMEFKNILSLRIAPNSIYYTLEDRGHNFFSYSKDSKYLLNHQPGLWNREFFLSCLEKGETPWINEKQGTKRLQKIEGIEDKIYHYIYDWFGHVCRKGQMNDLGIKLSEEAGLL
jgi:hypothetical protein